ncbi:uncharacterized protein LOC134854160 isoform X2 [Symsagittifera roscoffensis]|uniref:uncharacterized protein LOC134854160 isoform X2 n=1 Tax=Symsagittifera roscoffensis TaxID=84072 RepID=UPI00307BEC01
MTSLVPALCVFFAVLQKIQRSASLAPDLTSEIELSQKQIDKFNSGDENTRSLVMTQVNLIFQKELIQSGNSNIQVTQNDFDNMEYSLPNFSVDTHHCTVSRLNFRNPKLDGSFQEPAFFTTGAVNCDPDRNDFLKVCLKSKASFHSMMQMEFSAKILGKCKKYATKTVRIDHLDGSGYIVIKAQISGTNAKIVSVENKPQLQFGFSVTLSFEPVGWKVDKLSLSRCSVTLGRWKIGSYCSVLTGMIEQRVPIDKWNNFIAEKIIAILGKATNETVGQQVSIPVRVVNIGREGKHEL